MIAPQQFTWQEQVRLLQAQFLDARRQEDAAFRAASFPVTPEQLAALDRLSAERQHAARALAFAVDNLSDERHSLQLATFESGDDLLTPETPQFA